MKLITSVSPSRSIGIGLAILLVSMLPAPVGAQQSQSGEAAAQALILEEIIVTARRREENLQDIPASITAFTSEDLLKSNIRDVKDYFSKTPNVSFTESGTRGERDISIRGVSNIGGQASALAFYVDEFNIINGPQTANTGNTNSSINPQLVDIERIEVLRGPQGTYFGRNATGGAINITTKKPAPEFSAEVGGGYGRLDTWEATGIVNIPLVEDLLYFRASAFYEESNGFVRNVNPVGGRSDTNYQSYRAAMRFIPTEKVLVDFTVNYTNEEQGLPETVPNGLLSAGSAGLSAAAGFPGGVDEVGFYPSNLKLVNNDLKERQENEFLSLVGRIEIDADWATITSVTGYLDTQFMSIDNDLDGTGFGFLDQDREVETESISQEIRIAGDFGQNSAFSWVVGGIYAEDDKNQIFSVRPGTAGFLGLPPGFPIDTGDISFETESWAIFGELTWRIDDRLTLTAGGRYTDDTVSQRVEGINFGAPDVPGAGEVSFDDFSPRVTLSYALTEDVMSYVAVSKGYKAGGLQLNVTQQLPVFDFQDETIWNYEGGLKMVGMNGRLQSNLSIFYMNWDDLQVSTNQAIVDPVTNEITFLNVTNNAAGATSKGAEFDLRVLPFANFEFGAAVGYLDAKFDSFEDAFVLGSVVDLSGRRIPRAPRWTTSLDAEYRVPLSTLGATMTSWGEGYLRAEYSYRSSSLPVVDSLIPNPQQLISEEFDLLNIRAGINNERFRVDAYVENVLDEVYFTTFVGFGFAGARINPTYRTYGVRFHYLFQ